MSRNARAVALLAMLAAGALPSTRREVAVVDPRDDDTVKPEPPRHEYPYHSYRRPPEPPPAVPETRQQRRARERAEAKRAARMARSKGTP